MPNYTLNQVTFAGAENATLITAFANYNTAADAAFTAASAVSNVVVSSIKFGEPQFIWNGTDYAILGNINYAVES